MGDKQVRELEGLIGKELPEDYRAFLVTHEDRMLEREIVFQPPRSGVIDEILTVGDILANDEAGGIGIPEKSLLHIGGNLFGGYLYLDLSPSGFGEIHYMEAYTFRESFPSFGALLGRQV